MASREEAYKYIYKDKRLSDDLVADILYEYLVQGYTQNELEEKYFPSNRTVSYTVSYIQQAAGLKGRNAGKYNGEISYSEMQQYAKLLRTKGLGFKEFLGGNSTNNIISDSHSNYKGYSSNNSTYGANSNYKNYSSSSKNYSNSSNSNDYSNENDFFTKNEGLLIFFAKIFPILIGIFITVRSYKRYSLLGLIFGVFLVYSGVKGLKK
ncbi:Uncharacterised protein [Anaerococcus vaginalis]|uniref:Uncharacterized protein n=1 Tax=Anaerococcus vaginalis TaxID=33037 RepID=A0A6N2RVS9_9FIRM